MFLLNKSKSKSSSRNQIRIKEVKQNILVLPGNQYRVVLETSSINFELKSEREQDQIIDSFELFLNSLPVKLQILIRTREIDIDNYLEQIDVTLNSENEKIYKDQITDYKKFVKSLVMGNKILSRRFFIVISYQNSEKTKDFNLIKEGIGNQLDIVKKGLEKMGMKTRQLNSFEILDLFYSFYNPNQTKTQALKTETIEMLMENNYV